MKVTVVGAGNVGATCADVLAYREIANEAEASFVWGQKYGQPWGERLAQAITVWRLFRHRRSADILAMGRYGEMLMLLQAVWPFGRRPALSPSTSHARPVRSGGLSQPSEREQDFATTVSATSPRADPRAARRPPARPDGRYPS